MSVLKSELFIYFNALASCVAVTGSVFLLRAMVDGHVVDVAHETSILGSLHCRPFEEPSIVVFAQLHPLFARHRHQFFAGLELRNFCGLGKAVPRASLLATVATINEIAHLGLGGVAQCTPVLNGLVG